jgi:TPP-dependent 2-oxoacid decarboxylase
LFATAGTTLKQENLKLAEEQQTQAAEGPIKEVAAEDAQKFGKEAITQAYLWPRMGKWYRENDVIVSETGYVVLTSGRIFRDSFRV